MMFGLFGKDKSAKVETVTYVESPSSDTALRLEIGGRLPVAAIEAAGKIPDALKSMVSGVPDQAKAARGKAGKFSGRAADNAAMIRDRATDRAGKLSDKASDRAKSVAGGVSDRARSLADSLPDRDTAYALVDRLPDPMKVLAQDKLGLKPRRSRWKTVAIVLAVTGGAAAALLMIKRVFAPGHDEEWLYSGPDDLPGGSGEPHAYPTAGSGTGWPEPAITREHTEMINTNGHSGDGIHPGEAPPAIITPPIAAGSSTSATSSPAMPQPPRPTPMPPAPTVSSPASSAMSDAATQQFSRPTMPELAAFQPAQRPTTPFTEDQAEMNARLQLKQTELYAAFPGMSSGDIVACDGYLDRLTEILTGRTGTPGAEVRVKLDTILATGPKDATNPVLPQER